MPNNRRNSLKDIKNKESVHPYSRKAKQISRAISKEDKKALKKARPLTPLQAEKCDRFCWFKYALDDKAAFLNNERVAELIESYLVRDAEELNDKSNNFKKEMLKQKRLLEKRNYLTSGIEIPDLTSKANVEALRAWDGDWNGITLIKGKTFTAIKPKVNSSISDASSVTKAN